MAQPPYPSASSEFGAALNSGWGTRLKETVSSQFMFERGEVGDKTAAPWVLPEADAAFIRESKVSELTPSFWSQALSHRWNGNPCFYTPC